MRDIGSRSEGNTNLRAVPGREGALRKEHENVNSDLNHRARLGEKDRNTVYVERIPRRTWRNDEVSRWNRQEGLSGSLFHPDSVIHSGYQRHPAPCFTPARPPAFFRRRPPPPIGRFRTRYRTSVFSVFASFGSCRIPPRNSTLDSPFFPFNTNAVLGFAAYRVPFSFPRLPSFLRREILNIQIFLCERGKTSQKAGKKREREREGKTAKKTEKQKELGEQRDQDDERSKGYAREQKKTSRCG